MMRRYRVLFLALILAAAAVSLCGCGGPKLEEHPDFAYVMNDTGEYARVVRYKGTAEKAVIPDVLSGKPVQEIAASTFENAPHVTEIVIPASVKKIGDPSFHTLPNLKTIEVAPENIGFTVQDGVLFHKKMKTLYCYPQGLEAAEYTLPDTVTTLGAGSFYHCKLEKLVMQEKVAKIYAFAFADSENLSQIVFSPKLTQIYESAFENCKKLTNVELPASVTSIGANCFKGCTEIETMVLPEKINSLGSGAFMQCEKLKSVQILAKKIQRVAEDTFNGCKNMENISFAADLMGIAERAFKDCEMLKEFPISDKCTVIGEMAFSGCRMLENVNIPDNLTAIGGRAFENTAFENALDGEFAMTKSGVVLCCRGEKREVTVPQNAAAVSYLHSQVEKVILPEGMTMLSDGAFSGCEQLKTVEMPESLTSIGAHAFKNCRALEKVVLPVNLTSIGSSAFEGCESITAYEVQKGNKTFTSDHGVLYNNVNKYLIAYPAASEMTEYRMPYGCLRITEGAVRGAANLEKFDTTEAETMLTVEKYAFADCPKLKSVKFHENFSSLGDYAFMNCTALSEYQTNYTMTEIGEGAFMNCTSLKKLTLNQPLAKIGKDAFKGNPELQLTVYSGQLGEEYVQAYHLPHVTK